MVVALLPCKPLPSLPLVHVDDALYIRVVDKFNSKGGRDKRVLLVRPGTIVLVDVRSPHSIKRSIRLTDVHKLITKGDALLFKITKQHDLLTYFPNDSRNVDKFDIGKITHILRIASQALKHSILFQSSTNPLKSQANVAKAPTFVDPQLKIETYLSARKKTSVHSCHKPNPEFLRQITRCQPLRHFSEVYVKDASYLRIVTKINSHGSRQERILMLRPRTMLLVDTAKGHKIKRCIEYASISKIITFDEELVLFKCPLSHDMLIQFKPSDSRNVEPFSMGKLMHILHLSSMACGFSIQSSVANSEDDLRGRANLFKQSTGVSPSVAIEQHLEDKRQREIDSCTVAATRKEPKAPSPPTPQNSVEVVKKELQPSDITLLPDNDVPDRRQSIISEGSCEPSSIVLRKASDQPLGMCFAAEKDLTIRGVEPGSPASKKPNFLIGNLVTHVNSNKVESVSDVVRFSIPSEVVSVTVAKVDLSRSNPGQVAVVQKHADSSLGVLLRPSTLQISGFEQNSPLISRKDLVGRIITHIGSTPVTNRSEILTAGIGAEVVTLETVAGEVVSEVAVVDHMQENLIKSLISENNNLKYLLSIAGPPIHHQVSHDVAVQTNETDSVRELEVAELQCLVEHLSVELDKEKIKNKKKSNSRREAFTNTDTINELTPVINQFCDQRESSIILSTLSSRGVSTRADVTMDALASVPPVAARKILRACQAAEATCHEKCNYRLRIAHEETRNLREAIDCLKQQIAVLQSRLNASNNHNNST